MSRRLIITSLAQQHIVGAARWYQSEQAGLGWKFLETIERRLEMIEQFPAAAPLIDDVHRRVLLKPFQWGLFYRLETETIVVVGVLDLRRHPDHQQQELGS